MDDWGDDDDLLDPQLLEEALIAADAAVAARNAAVATAEPEPEPAVPPPARRRRLPPSLAGPAPAAAGTAKAPASAAASAAAGDENLPLAEFPGRPRYAFTSSEVEGLCQALLASGVAAVGFDIEWRVTYQPGVPPRPVALIQLCFRAGPPPGQRPGSASAAGARHECLLLHIAHAGLPPSLRALLCSQELLKVGVGSHGDALKMQRDFGLEMGGVVDLSEYANARAGGQGHNAGGGCAAAADDHAAQGPGGGAGCSLAQPGEQGQQPAGWQGHQQPAGWQQGHQQQQQQQQQAQQHGQQGDAAHPMMLVAPQKWSLAALVSRLMRLRLPKSQSLRCSNWEAPPPLTTEQQTYAATDAWASLRCYEILSKLPVVQPPAPPPPAAAAAAAAAAAGGEAPAGGQQASAADWVPACATLRHLQPAKLAVYQAVVLQGLSVAQVAAQRRIQEHSVQGYLGEAISAGLGYSWSSLGVPASALQQVADVAGELLGRQLAWQPGGAGEVPAAPSQQQLQQEEQGAAELAVGSKRPPPCSPTAASEGQQAGGSGGDDDGEGAGAGAAGCPAAAQDAPLEGAPAASGEPVDVLERLLAAGHKLSDLKEERFEGISWGHLRLAMAHLGRTWGG